MKKNKIIAFPASFDLMHDGHIYLIKSQMEVFDKIFIIISNNPTKKHSSFIKRRIRIIDLLLKNKIPFKKIKIINNKGMTTDILKQYDIKWLLRGYRDINDYIYENELYDQYLLTYPDLKRILIKTTNELKNYRSSLNKH